MTVLIVGGSGFLGDELVRQALAAGHRVAATYRTQPIEVARSTAIKLIFGIVVRLRSWSPPRRRSW